MVIKKFCVPLCLVSCVVGFFSVSTIYAQTPEAVTTKPSLATPQNILVSIIEAEDKRLWDNNLSALLKDSNPSIRTRAALAAGRIGDEAAVPALVSLLQNDKDNDVRAMAAFGLGEIESPNAVEALVAELAKDDSKNRARAFEALGKIAAALPATDKARLASLQKEILNALDVEAKRSTADTEAILLGLTAALRARPEGAGKVVAQFLNYSNSRIRADAANALARLRAKDGNEQLRKLLITDPDPIVRANAARVLGATEDKAAFEVLTDRAITDTDLRVRISSLRALAILKDLRTAAAFRSRADTMLMLSGTGGANKINEILEQVAMMGRVLQGTEDKDALLRLSEMRRYFRNATPPVEIAFASISPSAYLSELGTTTDAIRKIQQGLISDWNIGSAIAQGLREIAATPDSTKDKSVLAQQAEQILRGMLDYKKSGSPITSAKAHPEYAVPDILRALAAFKPKDLHVLLLDHLKHTDVIVRATAAELLGELPPEELTASALILALPVALKDKENDAVLEILDSLAKQKTTVAHDAIKSALESPDYLIRRRAVSLLKTNGVADFSAKNGPIKTLNTTSDYQRAISRFGKTIQVVVRTSKGSFTISLFPEQAPLTVDNFVQLAKRRYFNGISFHRVVPNFVIQGGDPRGDGSGGPGYAIRCEINLLEYDRGVVGMALSGKDTGGSQWFVTHSPQPHLDGGYTVFGKVFDGMDVVDIIARGDVIKSIVITSNSKPEK